MRATSSTELRFRDLFEIKRGIATGANDLFIVDAEQIRQHELPSAFLTPILPSPRYLESDEVLADPNGNLLLKRPLWLLNCDLPEDQVAKNYPPLWHYFQLGVAQGIKDGYLCRHRAVWYAQDKRRPSPFLCTSMGRPSNGHTTNPFGSGTVESGVKQFKQRLSGTGMRWNDDNANRMLVIRSSPVS